MINTGPPVHFINLSYFFQLLYNAFFGGQWPTLAQAESSLVSLASTLWFWLSIIAYLLVLFLIGIIVYYYIRYKQCDEELEEIFGSTIPETQEHAQVEHARWKHVRELIESPHENDWRSAIIEADIMLDEMLARNGYEGPTLGDKLKSASRDHFHTLQDAWDAHNVRNEIAHQGSQYQLSPQIAYRTIAHYENVFREFNEI